MCVVFKMILQNCVYLTINLDTVEKGLTSYIACWSGLNFLDWYIFLEGF